MLEDIIEGKAWIVFGYDDQPLATKHGGLARLLASHLYFWKSAKWIQALVLRGDDELGF